MNSSTFDAITRGFADRRLSRRQALAAAGLATTGISQAVAQDATPVSSDMADGSKTQFLFVQSYESGTIVPKEGEAGSWTLTLEQGLGQTVFFSDRPERIAGVSDTDAFLKGLGFSDDNPPNAALLFTNDKGEEDVSVIELFNPRYDTNTQTATYDIQLLKEYAGLEMTFQEQPAEPPDAGATFEAAHLFIDDCADAPIACCSQWDFFAVKCVAPYVGQFPTQGYCYNWKSIHCEPCDPFGHDFPSCGGATDCPEITYWANKCNAAFSECNGICQPIFYP